MAEERWYFSKEQLMNSPSRQCGLDQSQESLNRQQAANLIQDMGQKLLVSQLCINTAIVYMHRFYAFHSFTLFHRNQMAAASLFLAAKVEEQPRKLEHVIKAMKWCINRDTPPIDPKTKEAVSQMDDLAFNENILLQTLGFDVAIDHPHTHVVKTCHLIRAPKELTQTSYFMASNSLHKTTMCLQYKPSIVACFCIHVACKWSSWQIPQSKEGKHWYEYVDPTVTGELLDQLTLDFLHHFDRNRAKSKLMPMEMPLNAVDNMAHKEPRRSEQSSRHSVAPGAVVDHKHRPSSSRQHSHSQSQSQSQSNSYSSQSSGNQPGSSQSRSSSQGTHQSTHQVRNNDMNVMQQHNTSGMVHNHHKSQNSTGSHQSHSSNPNASISYDNQTLSYPNVQPREYRDQNKRAEERALMNANKSYSQQQEQVSEHRSSSSNIKRVSSADTTSQQKHRLHNQIPSQNTSHPITNKDQSHYPTGSTRDRQGYYNQSESEHRMYNETARDNRPDVMKLQKQEHKSRPSTSNSSSDNKDGNNSNISKSFSSKPSTGSHEQRSKTVAPLFFEPKATVSNSYSFDEPNRSEFVRTPPKQTKIASLFSPDGIDPPITLMKKPKHESKSIVHKKHSPKDKRERKPEIQKKTDRKSQEINIVKSEKLSHTKTEINVPGTSSQAGVPSASSLPSPGDKFKQKTSKNKSRMMESNVASTAEHVEDRLFGDCSRSGSSLNKSESIKMDHPSTDISSYGIETNPDMISSLLKDSLFNTNEQSQFDYSSFSLPDQPTSPSPESIFNEPVNANDASISVESLSHIDSVQAAPIDSNPSNSSDYKSKSEKKKKKEKHKHKDKDRERSRDDRKKHKKDKDRHKDRKDDVGSIPAGPLKITIPKDKINLEMSEPSLKIKIPKDRLTSVPSNESKVALKIKIPKDVIEYNKKRDRDRSSDKGPPSKSYKLN